MIKQSYKEKRSPQGKILLIGGVIIATIALFIVVYGLNTPVAGAGNTNASTFGLSQTASQTTSSENTDAQGGIQTVSDLSAGETSVLTKPASRNIDQAVNEMLAKEEAERIAAEQARLAAEAAKKAELDALQARSAGDAAVAGLEAVDWTLDHDTFVNHWSSRIDAYLGSSPLGGHGAAFAEAAWKYGIDPRISPAISNTESSKGSVCFLPYNAWGWGQSSWSSWDQAIDAHVSGLVKGGYGPMITYSGAQRYCPPNYDHWYKSTTSEMARI
ncbi:MAG: CMP-2-keto-3-deoxyoctulosonic acid synthetase [Raoultibacter sp.]